VRRKPYAIEKSSGMFMTISLLINNMAFAISIEASGIESIIIQKDYTIEKRRAIGGVEIFNSVSSANLGSFDEETNAVWVSVKVKNTNKTTYVKNIFISGKENSVFANPSQNNFFVEGEIRLVKGENTIRVKAVLEDGDIEEYEIDMFIGDGEDNEEDEDDENNDSSSRRSSSSSQRLRIISTDVGATFLTYKNEHNIVIDKKYKNEIISKAKGLKNFTVDTCKSENPGTVQLSEELLEGLKKDSNIFEVFIRTVNGCLRIRLDDLINKGDIKISLTKVDELPKIQENVIPINEMYTIEIFSIIDDVTTKLNKFEHNIEIILSYEIGEEDYRTITMYSIGENGDINNLMGTYDTENKYVYSFVKELVSPITAITNPVEFYDIKGYEWAEDFIIESASKDIVSGKKNGIFAPGDNITRAEFITLLMKVADIEIFKNANNKFIDVGEDSWYYYYIATANTLGLISGTSETTFEPDKNINREDMAVMIENLLKYIVGEIKIKDQSEFSMLESKQPVNRAEAVIIINKLFKLINRFYIEELVLNEK
jgi:hypothetical protein